MSQTIVVLLAQISGRLPDTFMTYVMLLSD